jgi:hypothetical protein
MSKSNGHDQYYPSLSVDNKRKRRREKSVFACISFFYIILITLNMVVIQTSIGK